ncbi:MAG TPA: hypothetical protein VFK45_01970 [Gammaproteobacteria bacterium]|nr:hypothetical protein [Gammaproteobacteria bacterium]
MRTLKHLLLAAAVAVIAAMGLSACNADDNSAGGMAINSPAPDQPDQPDQPSTPPPDRGRDVVFGDWVHGQFDSDKRNSDAAAPVNVGKIDFTFNYKHDPHAFDDLLSGQGG